jgi:hypothetical protein
MKDPAKTVMFSQTQDGCANGVQCTVKRLVVQVPPRQAEMVAVPEVG